MTIRSAFVLDSPLLPGAAVVTIGAAVVVCGTLTPDWGRPGENGLEFDPGTSGFDGTAVVVAAEVVAVVELRCDDDVVDEPAPSATDGASSHPATIPTSRPRRANTTLILRPYRSEASGCSIAGVSGASRYGCSSSTCSS
jgi:hypothetical protein